MGKNKTLCFNWDMNKTAIKYIQRGIILILSLIVAVLLFYMVAYGYLFMKAAFTWQCKIYVGEMSVEGREVCDHYNHGGFYEVLTN